MIDYQEEEGTNRVGHECLELGTGKAERSIGKSFFFWREKDLGGAREGRGACKKVADTHR